MTAYGEAWALYAEVLPGELGPSSGVQAQPGALSCGLFRAVRLVVDTGIPSLGWSRERALCELGEVACSYRPS